MNSCVHHDEANSKKFLYINQNGVPINMGPFLTYESFFYFIAGLRSIQSVAIELDYEVNDTKLIVPIHIGNTISDDANGRIRLPFTTNIFDNELPLKNNKPTPMVMDILSYIETYINSIFKDNEVTVTGDFIGEPKPQSAELYININNVLTKNGEPVAGFFHIVTSAIAKLLYNSKIIYINK